MKLKSIVILVTVLGAVGGAQAKETKSSKVDVPNVVAEDGDAEVPEKRKKLLEQYDEDGDGKISLEEREKFLEDKKARKAKKAAKKAKEAEETEDSGE